MKSPEEIRAKLDAFEAKGMDVLYVWEAASALGVSDSHLRWLIRTHRIESRHCFNPRSCWLVTTTACRSYLADSQHEARFHREQKRDIDLGLAILDRLRRPGEQLSTSQIAEACGCSESRIQQIEAQALRKLRRAMAARGLTLESLQPR